jgi:hypothetical protein
VPFDYAGWIKQGFNAWLKERVKKAKPDVHPGEHMAFSEFYADYKGWCSEKRIDPMSTWQFGSEFDGDEVAGKYSKRGRVYFAGIVLRP